MRIAAIDLGSNSLHMVLVDTDQAGAFRVIGREKEMVRLGERSLSRGRLTAAAMKRALDVLRKYKRLAESGSADKVLAVATSAVREARNGEEFLETIGRELDIWPRAISGDEEARLIYLAALHSIHLEGRRALVVDIGGGSVELALGRGDALELRVSEKIGVLRLSEDYVKTDPLSTRNETRLVKHLDEALKPHVEHIRAVGFDTVVGTSGTVLALGALALESGGKSPDTLHHATVPAADVHALRKRISAMGLKARLKIPGLDESRADIIVPGAILLDTLLERLGARELVLCEWALREGVLLDYIHRNPRSVARAEAYPDVRQRSVVSLGERCGYDEKHARKVAQLALDLFDATIRRHRLGAAQRTLLEYASLLHAVGHHISYRSHHKHAYYLIKNADLRGFTPKEVEVLANIARYHRRPPRKKHAAFAALARADRRVVEVLSAHLRLADALDRSHHQVVKGLTVRSRGETVLVQAHVAGDTSLEMWGMPRQAALLSRVLGARVKVEIAPAAAVAAFPRPERLRARTAGS
jgi:exopolyphosphatase/guanosine-5'-triphosphate,3'-diphosphate pyrophosphatase